MGEILAGYDLNPTTWVYIASLMIVGIFFKFSRFWSVRNLDLVGLIAFTPGMLLVAAGRGLLEPFTTIDYAEQFEQFGFIWLFTISGFFFVRLLLDALMVRRPLLEPNLSAGGLVFTTIALLVFLTANVVTDKVKPQFKPHVEAAAPGFPPFTRLAGYGAAAPDGSKEAAAERAVLTAATRTTAIVCHVLVVLGLVLIGYRHFDNIQTGVAAAALYLLTPYTAETTQAIDHVVSGALLIWAVQCYRRPAFAGLLIGLAGGIAFYPLFLLPLWCAFYFRRGLVRFLAATIAALVVLAGVLALIAADSTEFVGQLAEMFGKAAILPPCRFGFWEDHEAVFRIPVMVAFAAVAVSFALWPAQKNLATLLSCSAAVMVGAQFCHPVDGGLYMGWYLPLLIMTILRPNLEDRVALSTVRDAMLRWRRRG